MNKTLIALTCASMAVATAADDWSLTTITTNTSGEDYATGSYSYYGFQFTLSDNRRMDLAYLGQDVTPLPDELTLKSITLAPANGTSSSMKAVLTNRAMWTDEKPYDVLGVSDSFTKGAAETVITFGNGIVLETGHTYSVYFVAADTTVENTFNPSGAQALSMLGVNTGDNSANDKYAGFLIQNGGGQNSYLAPSMTLTLAPEPATATLSLLALAGLAARRRRH